MKTVFKILVIFLIVSGVLIFLSKITDKQQVVLLTENGFSPSQLIINQGSTVTFRNSDNSPHWPASDLHPTHALYSEFDPTKEILPQKQWQFTFQNPGRWKFHDHLLPHNKGIIIVQSKRDLTIGLSNIFNRPQNTSEVQGISLNEAKFKSLNPQKQFLYLKKYSQKNGLKNTWGFIKKSYQDQPEETASAHDLAHYLGGLIFDKENFSGLSICTPDFAFGCYHGFLDKAFLEGTENLALAENACNNLGDQNSGPVASCIHGIGHGLASFYGNKEMLNALKECDGLSSGMQFCYDGVFMEFARSAPNSFYKSEDPLFPCNTMSDIYQTACGRNQPQVMMQRLKMLPTQIAQICSQNNSQDFQVACIDSLGFYFVQISKGGVEPIIQNCSIILQTELKDLCLQAAAGELVFQNIPNWIESSSLICQNSSSDEKRNQCNQYFRQLAKDYQRTP